MRTIRFQNNAVILLPFKSAEFFAPDKAAFKFEQRRAPDALLVGCDCTQANKFENNTVRHKKDKRLVAENMIANPRFYPARPNPTACGCSWIPIIQTAVGRVVALHGF